MEQLVCIGEAAGDCTPITLVMSVLICAFLSILFLQSGVDKIVDRKGNIEWLTGHFANSAFRNVVPLLVSQIMVMEMVAGALCGVGGVILLTGGGPLVALVGTVLASLSLICLFLGQRLAKDYDGAAVLVNYFMLTLLGLYVLAQ